MPSGDLGQGHAQHGFGQQRHQPGAFGQRNELVRRDQAPLGMPPAHQRLDAEQAAVGQRHLGLVVQFQLVVHQRLPQFTQQGQPIGPVVVAFPGVGRDAQTGRLGVVHGHVGHSEQVLGVLGVLGEDGEPDRGSDVDRRFRPA